MKDVVKRRRAFDDVANNGNKDRRLTAGKTLQCVYPLLVILVATMGMPSLTLIIVLFCAALASAVLSPVLGPWTVRHAVDVRVTWANESAGLVQVDVGATATPVVVEVDGDVLFVIQRPAMPAWAVPLNGAGGVVVDMGAGLARVWLDPTGEILVTLTNPGGNVALTAGMQLHWRAFSFRFVPQLRAAPARATLLPAALPYSVARGDDRQVTLSLWTTAWAPTGVTRELEFSTVLPKSARPAHTVTTWITANLPAWNALCQLTIASCGSVTLKCAGGMANPTTLPAGDTGITYVGLV